MKYDKDEIENLDQIVTRYSLNLAVCANRSDHVISGSIPSDMMFNQDGQMFVKNIATTKFGLNAETVDSWSPLDCKEFYNDEKIYVNYPFQESFCEGNRSIASWYLVGRAEDYVNFLRYRWDNGLLFLDYSERVNLMLSKKALSLHDDASVFLGEIQEIIDIQKSLQSELKEVINTTKMSERLSQVLSSMKISITDITKLED